MIARGLAAPHGDGLLQGLVAHDRAVHLLLRKPSQVPGDILVGDLPGLLNGRADDHLGQCGGRRYGAAAAEGLEFGVPYDALLVYLEIKLEGVAAHNAPYLGDRIGVVDLTHILRVHV